MKVNGNLIPLRTNVFVSDMEFGHTQTASGLFIPSDNGKTGGIHPRWGKVWAIGPEQTDVRVGDWVLVEHGRWSRTVEYENDDGTVTEIRLVDKNSIIAVSDYRPDDVLRAESV